MANDFIYASVADLQKLLAGNAGAQSFAILNNVMAETIGMSMHNAVTAQQNAQMLNSATTTSTCARILASMGVQPPPPPAPTPPAPTPPDPNNGQAPVNALPDSGGDGAQQ
jgi:hypothetical protein